MRAPMPSLEFSSGHVAKQEQDIDLLSDTGALASLLRAQWVLVDDTADRQHECWPRYVAINKGMADGGKAGVQTAGLQKGRRTWLTDSG